jgi:hypothetical protein
MDINDALFIFLTENLTLSPLIGKRVYPDYLPKNPTYPSIVYSLISETEVDTFNQPLTLITSTFQFASTADTKEDAREISKIIRLAFKNFSGKMGGTEGITVSGVNKVGRVENDSRDKDGGIVNYEVIDDYAISYQEEGDD